MDELDLFLALSQPREEDSNAPLTSEIRWRRREEDDERDEDEQRDDGQGKEEGRGKGEDGMNELRTPPS